MKRNGKFAETSACRGTHRFASHVPVEASPLPISIMTDS